MRIRNLSHLYLLAVLWVTGMASSVSKYPFRCNKSSFMGHAAECKITVEKLAKVAAASATTL